MKSIPFPGHDIPSLFPWSQCLGWIGYQLQEQRLHPCLNLPTNKHRNKNTKPPCSLMYFATKVTLSFINFTKWPTSISGRTEEWKWIFSCLKGWWRNWLHPWLINRRPSTVLMNASSYLRQVNKTNVIREGMTAEPRLSCSLYSAIKTHSYTSATEEPLSQDFMLWKARATSTTTQKTSSLNDHKGLVFPAASCGWGHRWARGCDKFSSCVDTSLNLLIRVCVKKTLPFISI